MLSTYVGQSMTNLLQISAPGQKSRAHIFAGGEDLDLPCNKQQTKSCTMLLHLLCSRLISRKILTHWKYPSEMKCSGITVLRFFTKYFRKAYM